MKTKTPEEIAKEYVSRYARRYFQEFDRRHSDEIDALILWEIHEQLGFGEKRLKRFYDGFEKSYRDLQSRYECTDEEGIWVCQKKLLTIGVDLDRWRADAQN